MHFTRLRLSGFKSFVEPTDLSIEPGLTGIVGPNGCGKSNLLEALRWVMGASSARAMRGEGMDDVIFSGAEGRPSRGHAEVTLTVDNADRSAPARYVHHPVLEVTRRIDRGEGSTYRINGVEARARDVQLLFADASTGANSPALVRQGQISELIAARPQNRRRILEEAAGVAGLYGRRHEAELRVRGAEVNLTRLDDLARELDAGLGRLRREARAAARYKRLAADIRATRGALLHIRWAEAAATQQTAMVEAAGARLTAERATREAAMASAAALAADAVLPSLRDEDATAQAVIAHLAIETDRLERDLATARAEAARLTDERKRIEADLERESQTAHDAGRAIDRLEPELRALQALIAAAPARIPALEAAAQAADSNRALADSAVEALAAEEAAGRAQAQAMARRLEEARSRHARVTDSLVRAEAERGALDVGPDPRREGAIAALAAANLEQAEAREAVDLAERHLADAAGAESQARQHARAAEDELAGKLAEARGFARLAASIIGPGPTTVISQVAVEGGYEAALAAALGEDLSAGLDPSAGAYWAGASREGPIWPDGAAPLAARVTAPAELSTRLAFTAVVERSAGPRLQLVLPPGGRLVSREGDLWRWDGFTSKAGASAAAQERLEQKSRLASVEAEIARLRPVVVERRATHEGTRVALAAAEQAARAARQKPRVAETEVARRREEVERLNQAAARREARALALEDTLGRLISERDEAASHLGILGAESAIIRPGDSLAMPLEAARGESSAARDAAFVARSALDREFFEVASRTRRLHSLRSDLADWTRRARGAADRQTSLAADRERVDLAVAAARDAPARAQGRRQRLMDELQAARARKDQSADALACAEAARSEAGRAARVAQGTASDAREARAGAEARLVSAAARLADQAAAITEATGLDPQGLRRNLDEDAVPVPTAAAGAETHLAALERERDALGGVNLLAEEEVAELGDRLTSLAAERADLSGALGRLRQAIEELNAEGRERLSAAFAIIDGHFRDLFTTLFQGGSAELRLIESEDPLEAGLEILASPPGKRMAVMSLMSGGEQALTAVALIFAVFLANPAPICVLDEVDAPLDDANVERFCDLLAAMRAKASTRFLTITHNPTTMSRMDRLYGVTMRERGVSQLVSVDLREAEALAQA